jgi:hypothetical protein
MAKVKPKRRLRLISFLFFFWKSKKKDTTRQSTGTHWMSGAANGQGTSTSTMAQSKFTSERFFAGVIDSFPSPDEFDFLYGHGNSASATTCTHKYKTTYGCRQWLQPQPSLLSDI